LHSTYIRVIHTQTDKQTDTQTACVLRMTSVTIGSIYAVHAMRPNNNNNNNNNNRKLSDMLQSRLVTKCVWV